MSPGKVFKISVPSGRAKRPFTLIGGAFFALGLLLVGLPVAGHALSVRSLYRPDGQVLALTVQAGVLYLGGDFSQLSSPDGVSTVARAHLAALDVASGAPLAWDPGADGTVAALALYNGKILVGGTFSSIAGSSRSSLALLDAWPATGAASAWAPTVGPPSKVFAVAPGDNVVYVGGAFNQAGDQPRSGLAALDASGSTGWATSFNAALSGGTSDVNALLVDGGRLYVGGDFTSAGGQPRDALASVDPLSGAVNSFDPSSALTGGPVVYALAAAGGRLFVGGSLTGSLGGASVTNLVALGLSSGNQVWNGAADGTVRVLLPLTDGRLILGGDFGAAGGLSRRRFASLDAASGAAEAGLSADLNSGLAKLYGLASAGTELIVGGNFSSVAAVAVSHVAALSLAAYATPIPSPAPTALGAPAATAEGGLYAYPNPMSCAQGGHWVAQCPRAGLLHWQWLSPQGALLSSGQRQVDPGPAVQPLQCDSLSPGLYFLKVGLRDQDGGDMAWPVFKVALAP